MKEFLKELTEEDFEDLPEGVRLVATFCGIDVAIKLLEELPGIMIYIPKSGLGQVLKNYIKKNFDGTNAKKLALKTGYSEGHLYKLIQGNKPKGGDIEIHQMDMFNGGVEGND